MNMITILMMSAVLASPDLLQLKVFWNKGYDVIVTFLDTTIKVLSSDSS